MTETQELKQLIIKEYLTKTLQKTTFTNSKYPKHTYWKQKILKELIQEQNPT